jgi:ATP-dependent Lhr-like helicase
MVGPTGVAGLAESLAIAEADVEIALAALEREGVVVRGWFTAAGHPPAAGVEWCDRRLLARIHRYTLNRLRAEIEPVGAADFMRFLLAWQRVVPERRAAGLEGLAAVTEQLDGYELAAGAWETDVLSSRVDEYDPHLLDALCLTGRVAWGRLTAPAGGAGPMAVGPIRSTPIGLFHRQHRDAWLSLTTPPADPLVSAHGRAVRDALAAHGASFFQELTTHTGMLATQVEQGLSELAALGLVTADSFAGLRALLVPSGKRRPVIAGAPRRHRTVTFGVETAGRWVLLRAVPQAGAAPHPSAVEQLARALLRRYGVVFYRLLARESLAPAWRDLVPVYRRLEARGEIRGGRFVAGMAGEQFALPEAVAELRAARRVGAQGQLLSLRAADPLNLTGIITPGERVSALGSNRVLFRDGVPVAVREAGENRVLVEADSATAYQLERALVRKRVSPALRAYLGQAG